VKCVRHTRLRWALTLAIGLSAVAAIPGAAAAARTPEGSSLWFACTEPAAQFTGPPGLRCPVAYDPRYAQTFLQQFGRLTPENEFKMAFLEPEQHMFDFSLADQVARFAQAHGKTIRGHTLLWNQENPWWLDHRLLGWDRATLIAVMHEYISTVVGHFARRFPGVVTEWDVVNEPLTALGTAAWNPWAGSIGPDYVRLALQFAHAADPHARLLLNDDGNAIPGTPKAETELALAAELKGSGAPLDAVGFESHVTPATAPSYSQLVSLWERYRAAGLHVEVTELDVRNDPGRADATAKAAVFARYAQACRAVGNCTGLTVWGVADRYSWFGTASDALLYDSAFRPSPAAALIRRVLSGAG
jgi:endo-1,4-beta-xylanase